MSPIPSEAVESFQSNPRLLRLTAGVQHYAWGNCEFIPSLLGIENPAAEPYAELWMGAHPELPSRASLSSVQVPLNDLPLNEMIGHCTDEILGPNVTAVFRGRLPYLFKVLSAAEPLSIQAHPTKAQAEEGFARENDAGIPLSAKERNYKDDNHKPELIAALTDFYALRGFRPLSEIAEVLREVPEFRKLDPEFDATPNSLRALYESLMNLPPQEVDSILDPLVRRLQASDQRQRYDPMAREYWVLRADSTFSKEGHRDRGLFSIYLLNLIRLHPGEAMYLSAGVLHAYLQGSGMEIMANSNNVLRGGLTPKHVDVPELIRNVVFEGEEPQIVRAEPTSVANEWAYKTPAREFELRRIDVGIGKTYQSSDEHSADIIILVECENSDATVASGGETLQMSRGDICLSPFGIQYEIRASGPATFYKATVPAIQDPRSEQQAN